MNKIFMNNSKNDLVIKFVGIMKKSYLFQKEKVIKEGNEKFDKDNNILFSEINEYIKICLIIWKKLI